MCSDSSDLSVIPIYANCSPFNLPKPASSLINTVMKLASKDPERISYLSSLVAAPLQAARKGASVVPIAHGQQVLNIENYVLRAKIGIKCGVAGNYVANDLCKKCFGTAAASSASAVVTAAPESKKLFRSSSSSRSSLERKFNPVQIYTDLKKKDSDSVEVVPLKREVNRWRQLEEEDGGEK
ncbi:unnamed protein product [Fraxinus pennsylvanica]|uniref:Uncharacterized protein n=1 Tax=Fraxinus pennsylvanica TaxID=56036 RepID=A0AAD1YSQ5_9LAMI|nr:unnamed protein product [Fraxinus pennsylvanica]